MISHNLPFDARLEHRAAGQGPLTADTTLVTRDQRAQTRTVFHTNVRIESIDTSSGNERYDFYVECSNDNFTTVETAYILSLGHASVRLGGNRPTNVAGNEYQFPWVTEIDGVSYKSWRIRLDVNGSSPSIAFSCNSTC